MAGKRTTPKTTDPVVEPVLDNTETTLEGDTSETVTTETDATNTDGDATADAVITDDNATKDVEAVLSDITESVDSISGNTSSDVKVQVKKNKFNLTDKILCKSLFHGKLVYTSPTNGSRYIWNEYGATQHVPYVELETMNNHKPEILNKPLLLIMEPQVVEDFNLSDVYRKVSSLHKLGTYFETGKLSLIRARVKELIEVGMRDSVIADVRKRRKENTLVDINIINMLKVELKCDIG